MSIQKGDYIRYRRVFDSGVRLGGAEPKQVSFITDDLVVYHIWSSKGKDLGHHAVTREQFELQFEKDVDRMSMDRWWRPVIKPPEPMGLDYNIWRTLQERASMGIGDATEVYLGPENVDYLRGLYDGTTNAVLREDIKLILDAIDEFGEVKLWEGPRETKL